MILRSATKRVLVFAAFVTALSSALWLSNPQSAKADGTPPPPAFMDRISHDTPYHFAPLDPSQLTAVRDHGLTPEAMRSKIGTLGGDVTSDDPIYIGMLTNEQAYNITTGKRLQENIIAYAIHVKRSRQYPSLPMGVKGPDGPVYREMVFFYDAFTGVDLGGGTL